MVLAFYYVWFEPNIRWDIALDRPIIGRYSSRDRNVVLKHCEWAKEGGIDGFVVSLWKEERFGGIERVREITEVFEECGLKYTFYIENGDPAERIREVLKVFGDRKNLLRINGKPLIFVYSRITDRMSLKQRAELMGVLDSAYVSLHGFNGLNGFTAGNMHIYIIFRLGVEEAREMCDYAHAFGGLCALPVSPGFNLRKAPERRVPRMDGLTYVKQWRRAINAGADIVLITSFNEWEEGTHIEPSERFGFRYLTLTRRMAEEFKGRLRPRRITFHPPKLRPNLNLCSITGKAPTPVSLLLYGVARDVKDGRFTGCDVIAHDMGEYYDLSLIPRLVEYVRRGGTLLLAGGPYPLYKPYRGEVRPAVERFGIKIGFGPDLKGEWGGRVEVEGKGRSYRYYALGDTRLRTLENPHVVRYILRKEAANLGTVVGERYFGEGRVIFLWKGISNQPYLPDILLRLLHR